MRAFLFALLLVSPVFAEQSHKVSGLVLKVDQEHRSVTVSCDAVPNYMEAMVMTFQVRTTEDLNEVAVGKHIELQVNEKFSYADHVRVVDFESTEQEPQEAQRLKLLQGLANPDATTPPLALGSPVPDFAFTDQAQQSVALSQLSGKVVVLTFIYTRCPNPNYCFRLNSNLARLRKRFAQRLGHDLVLLSIVIDPEHDQHKTLTNYANIWKADPNSWHFLTGPLPDIQKVTRGFGMDFWSGEGAVTHTFHTIVIDSQGKLAANLEGNEFTARQLGDLVETELKMWGGRPRPPDGRH
ncbi:MAG TPA: SCO family protein [Terriglobales bacterium]|jgi:protein SCO1/2|nr:SCO family protein [Terriglobales bacterium]